ncbi:MAG: UDP-N-acetylmuramyl pentapeptide phosphotransferase/UDP-N-acetylglucosamine-1-phosphate transferase [Candidatus Daviesbacteria bacterium GW2011_GWA2_38_24]|uniref:UDP-N-acetylmuramyl pentapeptide phosphotransferase/UDP-N-acetylglucosamine-1-phosphate transferase n=1 Tax=Candidatus Daviesbacteria bacterium GW2011_GWA2_38_24 TaxID=1618422 RepID=A0A0G0JH51_9BACT|nr:MAG: UDP-N-acetylmuramyl pentapeptide phosphotransferase/UDP-N-acetylglucosamine-1-phosphate transferase [Candidatus Daviesbacteria bacterium GW2011_GWA2_38_24]KKQ80769.1 MAG: UDP-N-acetylmuramyl pentapeptide phosphotransferase/UDP-N-acetylglucosamine-1-phosphate transferase [Candidatus Daviesbacteria bacterium GW2011_GWA1_38_7]
MIFFLAFFLSFIITAVFVPFTIRLALKYGLVDDPKIRPHPAHFHKVTIPRAGGLAIFLGTISSVLILIPVNSQILGIVVGSTILLLMGLIDDKVRTFNPYLRLMLLFLAGTAAVFSGIGISFINNPLAHFLSLPEPFNSTILHLDKIVIPIEFFGSRNIILFADILALLWIVTLTQVINWSKGVDGQMPGITLITGIILGLLSFKFYLEGDFNQLNVAKLSFIVAGSSLGFLLFNWYPAKILPGFSGSTILAFLLAVLSILSGAKIATASLALAIPLIDFIYTVWRRILSGKSPVWGDRGHLHHKLLDLGWTPPQISLFYIAGSAILGSVALFVETQSKFFAILAVAIFFVIFILWINSFSVLSKQSGPDNG